MPKSLVVAHVRNEADFLLPRWLKHNYPMFDHGVLLDYHSTDDTPDVVAEYAPGWELRKSRNALFDATECDLEVMDVEREFNGYWKICLNVTEFLLHPSFKDFLERLYFSDVQGTWTYDIIMVDRPEDFDQPITSDPLHYQKHWGYHAGLSRSRLLHRAVCGNYHVGRHQSHLLAKTAPDKELVGLWWGWCPMKYVEDRKLAIQKMIPQTDLAKGLGNHHMVTREQHRENWMREVGRAVDLNVECMRFKDMIYQLKGMM